MKVGKWVEEKSTLTLCLVGSYRPNEKLFPSFLFVISYNPNIASVNKKI